MCLGRVLRERHPSKGSTGPDMASSAHVLAANIRHNALGCNKLCWELLGRDNQRLLGLGSFCGLHLRMAHTNPTCSGAEAEGRWFQQAVGLSNSQ